MKKLIVIFLIMVTIYGCEKDTTPDYSTSLTGEWSWFISCGGVVGCIGPSENSTGSLLFTVDSLLYAYRNDTLYSSWAFHTYKRITDDSPDTINFISYGSAIQEYSIFHDTLLFLNRELRSGSGYKRIKQEHFP